MGLKQRFLFKNNFFWPRCAVWGNSLTRDSAWAAAVKESYPIDHQGTHQSKGVLRMGGQNDPLLTPNIKGPQTSPLYLP